MENNYSEPEQFVVDLKQLPPIDPSRVMNSSFNGKMSESRSRAAPKGGKRNPNRGKKLVKSDEALRKSASASNVDGSETSGNTTSDTGSVHEGIKPGLARSNLYEICAASHWKPPIFECCKEEGPSHRRKYTFKVIIEIEAAPETIIECFGSPCQKKKIAADHAAEGALWYLKHQGHIKNSQ